MGGGVLFVPIVGGFFPFNIDFVRGAGLLVALAGIPAIADGGVLVTVRGWAEPVERDIRVFPVFVGTAIAETAKLERLRDLAESTGGFLIGSRTNRFTG